MDEQVCVDDGRTHGTVADEPAPESYPWQLPDQVGLSRRSDQLPREYGCLIIAPRYYCDMIRIVRSVDDLRSHVARWHADGAAVALVPTLGALHAGHRALVEHALRVADRVVASVFVNPAQFGPNEDFEKYPRDQEKDCAMLEEAGAHAAFVPDVKEMYPDGFSSPSLFIL